MKMNDFNKNMRPLYKQTHHFDQKHLPNIKINDASAGTVFVAKSMTINANSTLQFMQESKIVIEGGDYISILSNTVNCLNVTASVMEITPDS